MVKGQNQGTENQENQEIRNVYGLAKLLTQPYYSYEKTYLDNIKHFLIFSN